ncbi:MAG: Hsp20/alpha crystallin family protein [Deltaproteobacteria bacterium]|nr:Hsp20/alpha crystallin family protein [Deltaproteobacteria bacterium]
MLTRWSDLGLGGLDRGLSALNELRREMDRLFDFYDRDEEYGEFARPFYGRAFRVGLNDNGHALQLRAELPGFSEKDLNITIEQGSLTIRGERKIEVPEGYAAHRQERGAMQFARSFTLPSLIDTSKVEAVLKNGILELTMPKAEEARPREIQVRVK